METRIKIWMLVAILCTSSASAEYLAIEASEIASIEPTDKSSPTRILVKWVLPEDLDEKIIDGAVIEMPVPLSSGDKVPVEVAPMSATWSAATVSWSVGWSEEGGDFNEGLSSPAIVTERNDHTIRADVRFAILDIVSGEKTNFGFIIVPAAEGKGAVAQIEANNASALAKAKLIIAYRKRR